MNAMLLYLVIFLSFVGCAGAVVDYYLGRKQKERLSLATGNARAWLASVKSGPIVSRARERWVFAVSIVVAAALVFVLLGDVPNARWSSFTRIIETGTRVALSLPFLWWLSRAGSVRSLLLRAILSAGFSFAILLASIWLDIWPFPNLGFIGVSMTDDEVRDFMVFVVGVLTVLAGAPYLAGSAAAVLPVPLAYAGLGVLAATEFSLRRAIEPNRGRFIAICALFGAIAIFVKLSVH